MPPDGHLFSCSLTAVLVNRVRRLLGDDGPARLLRAAGSPRTLEYLVDLGNWVSYDEAVALWEAGARLTGERDFARHVGEDFVAQLAGSANSSVLRALGSPEALLSRIALAGRRFSTVADLEAAEVAPGRAEIRAVPLPGFDRHRMHCEWTAGLLTQVTSLFGLPPAEVVHDACQSDGAPYCRYLITWSTADSEVASLRAQLAAVSARLQSVFDTASDLIASGDLDGTLARITDRAAQQVRAPRYLLAVRPTPDAPLHVHQKGFEAHEARAVAERVLGDAPETLPGHWLVAPVCSERHAYGALVAVHNLGTEFFPHERELLAVYARYAATALDSATALAEAQALHREAQRRYDESRTLLELARRLAHAGSSDQIARRLADAVPGVVDCDRVTVYLWRPERGELVRQAINATGAGSAEDAGLRSVRPEDVPQLADWLERPDPAPLFIELETSPIQHSLREVGAVAAVAVPIATAERFLGCIVVSVAERPERLTRTAELVDRLSGVAAHAVTALENGRLVDHITHQARHDHLTGAANRVGFQERLAAVTAGAHEGSVALFYIDLDEFKPINDEHGHDVGDDLLRAVAQRLRERLRGDDTVARLGGDEFAVLVEDVSRPEQLAGITRRLAGAFADTLRAGGREFAVRASIGRAIWPLDGDSPEALLRHADAEMYAVKRAGRR